MAILTTESYVFSGRLYRAKIIVMNTKLPCGAQDLLEAAIVQQRRLDVVYLKNTGQAQDYVHVLPVDIASEQGVEWLTVMAADKSGRIQRLRFDTSQLLSFQADDELQPVIAYYQNAAD